MLEFISTDILCLYLYCRRDQARRIHRFANCGEKQPQDELSIFLFSDKTKLVNDSPALFYTFFDGFNVPWYSLGIFDSLGLPFWSYEFM